jgi:autotransporter translocation and assembly factor TamB
MRRILKWSGLGVIGLIGLIGIALVSGRYWLASDSGRSFLTQQATSAGVKLEGLSGDPFGSLTARRAEVMDKDGACLTITDAEIVWRPLALLQREVLVEQILAKQITVARAPVSDPPSSDASSQPSVDLPVAITIQKIQVDEIVLAEAVAGQAATLSLVGNVGYADDAADGRIVINRLDGPGQLALTAGYHLAKNAFDIDLKAIDPAGGLITNINGLENGLNVQLEGSGDLTAWTGRLVADSAAAPLADLALQITRAGHTIRLKLDGAAMPKSLVPAEIWDLLGDKIQLGLLASAQEDGREVILENLNIMANVFDLTGKGRLAPVSGDVTGLLRTTRLDAKSIAPLMPGVAVTDPSLSAEVTGTLAEPRAAITVNAAGVQAGEIGAKGISVKANVVAPTPSTQVIDWRAVVNAKRLSVGAPAVDQMINGPWVVDANGRFDPSSEHLPLTLVVKGGKGLSARFNGAVSTEGAGAGALSVKLAELKALAPLVGAPVNGPGSISTDVIYDAKGLGLSKIAVRGVGVGVDGRLRLNAAFEERDGAFDVTISDLARLGNMMGAPVAGAMRGELRVSGAVADPASSGELRLSPHEAAGQRFWRHGYNTRRPNWQADPGGRLTPQHHPPLVILGRRHGSNWLGISCS